MKRTVVLTMVAVLALLPVAASGAPEPENPKKQTPWHLYLDSREAFEMKKAKGDQMLLVDVRDPIEIMFTGFSDVVDVNVPFMTANRSKWNGKKSVFLMEKNPGSNPTSPALSKHVACPRTHRSF